MMLLVVHWQDYLCWFSYVYVCILRIIGSCTKNAFTRRVLLQLQGHGSLSQAEPECRITSACTTVSMCWSTCATAWEPDFPLCGKLHDFTGRKPLLHRKQQQKPISVEQRERLWVFDQNEGSSQHCPWFYVFYTHIFISIVWVVTPWLESFVHGACDGKRQEELERGG